MLLIGQWIGSDCDTDRTGLVFDSEPVWMGCVWGVYNQPLLY